MKPVTELTPLQRYQHVFSNTLEAAAEELNERERERLKHYVIQRALVELGYRSERRAGGQ